MNIFNLGIQRTGTGIPVQAEIDPLINPCIAASYVFDFVPPQEALEEGSSIEVELTGGIGPFTWTAVSPGISLAAASTIGRFNTVTCNLVPFDERASIQVTDSCGNIASTSIPISQEWDCGCLSGVCATYPAMVVTPSAGTDLNAIVDGDAFEVTGGLSPYRWRITGAAVDASVVGTGTIAGMYWASTSNYNMTITAIDACGRMNSITGTRYVQPAEIISGWILAPGETVEYNYGCDDDPRWSISCGKIDRRTGIIKTLDGCECVANITVTVDTGCGDPVDSIEANSSFSLVAVSGTEAPSVGSIYSAIGGVSPIVFSFTGGTINPDTGEILSISDCSDLGNVAMAQVSVTDSCGNSDSLDVRLPSGHWVYSHTVNYDAPESDPANNTCCGTAMQCGSFSSGTCTTYPDIISGNSLVDIILGARCGSWCVDGHWHPCTSPVGKAAPADFHDYCYNNDCYTVSVSGSSTFCKAYTFQEIYYTWECP